MGQAVEVQAEPIKSSSQSPPATDSSPNPDIPVVVTLDDHQATDSRLWEPRQRIWQDCSTTDSPFLTDSASPLRPTQS